MSQKLTWLISEALRLDISSLPLKGNADKNISQEGDEWGAMAVQEADHPLHEHCDVHV